MTNSPHDQTRPPNTTHNDRSADALLIDRKATARLLSLGDRTLWSLTRCGAIPARKIGRSVRYSPDELQAWIRLGCPTKPGSAESVRKGMR